MSARGRRRAPLALLVAGGLLGGAVLTGVPAGPAVAASPCLEQPATPIRDRAPAERSLSAQRAWQTATGAGVLVAVVDSGVDTRNPHLTRAVRPGTDLVGGAGGAPGTTDVWGHGTALAGIIAARKIEGSGLVGLAKQADILPVRVFVADDAQAADAGTGPSAQRIAEGIRWAAGHGAQIINVSQSTNVDTPALRYAVRAATAAGALVVASAGNRDTAENKEDHVRYPAAYPEVLGVAAVDADLQPTTASIHGPQVDVAAPGASVLAPRPGGGDCVLGDTAPSSSYATAYASAAAALLAERFPDETPAQWKHRLEVTAARAGADVRTDETGWGVIRPDEALAFVDDGSAVGPTSPAFPEAPRATPTPAPIVVAHEADPLAPVRAQAVWWALAGAAVIAFGALAWRLVTAGAGRSARRGPG